MSDSKRKNVKRDWVLALLLTAIGGGYAVAQNNHAIGSKQVSQAGAPSATTRLILVSIPDRKLVLVENGATKRIYPVAVGKTSTPSPAGQFTVVRRVADPTYSHHGKVVAPGPKNPVGSRWMGLSVQGYGIHGTNEPNSIGKAASHGCIRMAKTDLEDLYVRVQVGDAVEIHAQRDATVAMALGNTMPVLQATPVTVTPVNRVLFAGNAAGIQPGQGQ